MCGTTPSATSTLEGHGPGATKGTPVSEGPVCGLPAQNAIGPCNELLPCVVFLLLDCEQVLVCLDQSEFLVLFIVSFSQLLPKNYN